MLDIQFIKDNLELVKQNTLNKNRVVDWDKLFILDQKRRDLIVKSETLRKERNLISQERENQNINRAKEIKLELKKVEDELTTCENEFNTLMLSIPNVAHKSVPVGKDEKDNLEIRKWGKIREFDFKPLDHIELAKKHDLIDFERGAKVAGSRAYFLKNAGAILEFAIMYYTFLKLVKKGYTPLVAPSMVKEFTFIGNAQFPWGKDEVYTLPKDDLFLAGTAEVPVTAYFSDEVLKESELPKKFVAYSPCFRREAGSYGKDTRGIYRVHQFTKVEQVIISNSDLDNSFVLHEELLKNSEEILQDLELPYRVLLMCTGDMGEPQVKKYDIETWMPGRNSYGETMSNSVMGDFQARRLKIRYKDANGSIKYCHTLNNTALASPRILIPILENYQNKDGTITIPKVLRSLVGLEKIS